jgi:hypothetical protein
MAFFAFVALFAFPVFLPSVPSMVAWSVVSCLLACCSFAGRVSAARALLKHEPWEKKLQQEQGPWHARICSVDCRGGFNVTCGIELC